MPRRAAGSGPGRPYIGPKVQTHIPQPAKDWVKEEAQRRGVPEAEVNREVFLAGLATVGARWDEESGVIVGA